MIENTTNKQVYTITSGGSVFSFPCPFFEQSDLHCYLNNGSSEVELVQGDDFTVENKATYVSGANVTLLASAEPGNKLAIVRRVPLTQTLNLPLNGKIPSTSLEDLLDRIIMICQQLKETCDRCAQTFVTDGENSALVNIMETLASYVQRAADYAGSAGSAGTTAGASAGTSAGRVAGSAAALQTVANGHVQQMVVTSTNATSATLTLRGGTSYIFTQPVTSLCIAGAIVSSSVAGVGVATEAHLTFSVAAGGTAYIAPTAATINSPQFFAGGSYAVVAGEMGIAAGEIDPAGGQ